jgi:hypothetical protein
MRSNKQGERNYQLSEMLLDFVLGLIIPLKASSILQNTGFDKNLKNKFARSAASNISAQFPDLERVLEDCSGYIVDQLIAKGE